MITRDANSPAEGAGVTERTFTPCDPRCPAVTGKPLPNGSYCPMAEPERHARYNAFLEEGPKRGVFKTQADGLFDADPHPDKGDCCANFQCCVNDDTPEEERAVLEALAYSLSDPEQKNHVIEVTENGPIVREEPREED